MAVVSKSYLIEGTSINQSGGTILEAVEVFEVTLTDADGLGAARLYSAIHATGLPLLWSDHPVIPNLSAISYQPEFQGPFLAFVKVIYANAAPQVFIRGGCGLEQVQVNVDRYRRYPRVSNQFAGTTLPDNTVIPPVTDLQRIVQDGVAHVFRPRATFIIARVRPSTNFPGGINPAQQQKDFVGKINSNTTDIFGVSMPPGTLICENIGYDNDGLAGVAWRMSYEFRYRPEGFNPEVFWIDRETGEPGAFLTKDPNFDASTPLARICANSEDPRYGLKVIDCYETANFDTLLA